MDNKEIMITGGTGSLSKALVKTLCENYKPKGIRLYSRDELKQAQVKILFDKYDIPISYILGNVNDLERLRVATRGVDILIHAAAMKRVESCEENPFEAVQTNVHGAQNILKVALEHKIERVMNVTTDKAVYPVNLYGATKLVAEKLFINGNVYSGGRPPLFSCCRYGNVIGSRGSVIPLFKKQLEEGKPLTITNSGMTRFWITLQDVAQFIIDRIGDMKGGEIFVPKMPSMRVMDLASAVHQKYSTGGIVLPTPEIKTIGMRPGEKIHETLISQEESACMENNGEYFSIKQNVNEINYKSLNDSICSYSSDNNNQWLTVDQLKEMI